MQHCPSHISRGRPPPPAREPGLTRTGGLPPAPQPRPQDKTVHVDPAQKNWCPCFWVVGFRAPPPATSDPPKMDPAGPGWKDPLPGPGHHFPEGWILSHSGTRTHAHTSIFSQKV